MYSNKELTSVPSVMLYLPRQTGVPFFRAPAPPSARRRCLAVLLMKVFFPNLLSEISGLGDPSRIQDWGAWGGEMKDKAFKMFSSNYHQICRYNFFYSGKVLKPLRSAYFRLLHWLDCALFRYKSAPHVVFFPCPSRKWLRRTSFLILLAIYA